MASRQQNRIQAYLERNKIGPLFEVRAPPSLRLAGFGTEAAALGSSWRERLAGQVRAGSYQVTSSLL